MLTGNIIDDDSVRWTALADMGDGSAPIPVLSGRGSHVQLAYTYKNPGNYTVSILVTTTVAKRVPLSAT